MSADTNSEQIKRIQKSSTTEHEVSVIWVPRRTLVSDKILEDEGILGDVNVAELPIFFLALEHDVLSLEIDDAFDDLYLVRPTSHWSIIVSCPLETRHYGLVPGLESSYAGSAAAWALSTYARQR